MDRMQYAGFDTKEAALAWRSKRGGWVFVPDEDDIEGGAVWFSKYFTPTPILMHRATHGRKGTLI